MLARLIFTNSSLNFSFNNCLSHLICLFFGISFFIHVKMNYSIIHKIWIKLFFKQSFSPISTPNILFFMVFTITFSLFTWFVNLDCHIQCSCDYYISNSLTFLLTNVYIFIIFWTLFYYKFGKRDHFFTFLCNPIFPVVLFFTISLLILIVG